MRRKLLIDDDLWVETCKYVNAQLKVMDVELSNRRYMQIVQKVAEYPQKLRNIRLGGGRRQS